MTTRLDERVITAPSFTRPIVTVHPKPSVKSTDASINSLERLRATALFDDDYNADNKIGLNARFAGRSTIRFNALANTRIKDHEVQYNLHDDAQIDGTGFGFGFQAKFKPSFLSLHTDLGSFHRLHVAKDGTEVSLWNNPYVFLEASRKLRLNSFWFGNLFHLNNWVRNNIRINLWEKFAGNKGLHLNNNLLVRYQNFVLSTWMSVEVAESHTRLDEKLLLGYQQGDHSAALTLDLSGDRFLNAPRYGLLQVSTDLKDQAEVGVFVSKVLSEDGKLNFGIGLKKAITNEVLLKAKLDKDLKTQVYSEYKLGNGFNLEGTIARDFREENTKNGFLDSDYHLGVRLRYSG